MKKYLISLFLVVSCSIVKPTPIPVPTPTPGPIIYKDTTIYNYTYKDTTIWSIFKDTTIIPVGGEISITAFGAKCDGVTDDIVADSMACAYCIAHPYMCSTVTFPIGHNRITRPLLLYNNGSYFTVHLKGMLPAKEANDYYLSEIICDYKSGYGIGIQSGRGIILENLAILGKYTFPDGVTNQNIATLRFNDWVDPTISDSRYDPYAGICIDPYDGNGTSGVEIRQCSVKRWMVGICLSPENTVNDEMINIIDDDVESNRIAIAIGQDQSKEINIIRLKCWASTHTILDGLTYGRGTGGGSVDIIDGNIAGNVNELFNINTDRFALSVNGLNCESLFRIGTVGKWSGANFIDTKIDFLTGPGLPEPDFMCYGISNFLGGMLRYYDNDQGHRLNFTNMNSMFRDMTINSAPITVGLIGYPNQVWPTALFDHVNLYNTGYLIKPIYDSIGMLPRGSVTYLVVDSVKWTSTMYGPGLGSITKYNDYVLGNPASGWGYYYDRYLNPNGCPTIQIGRVNKISNDTLYMTNVALNAPDNLGLNAIYISRVK